MSFYPVLPHRLLALFCGVLFSAAPLLADVEVFEGQPTNAGQEYLLAAWNFNDAENLEHQLAVSHGVGILSSDWDLATFSNFAGSGINAYGFDGAGRDLGLRNGANQLNEGRHLTFRIAAADFEEIQLSYATRRSASGFTEQHWSWSLDGDEFFQQEIVFPTENYELKVVDFGAVEALRDASEVWLRLTLQGIPAQPSATGNNRLDNVQIRARAIHGTAGPGKVSVINKTDLSAFFETRLFVPGEAQVVEFLIQATDSETIESVAISRPAGWGDWREEKIEISGAGFQFSDISINQNRIEVQNAQITAASPGRVRISEWLLPSIESVDGWGRELIEVKTGRPGEALSPISPAPEVLLVVPIERLRKNPGAIGQMVGVSGVATVASGVFSVLELSVFIQDPTAGIEVYAESIADIWKPVSVGNLYTVMGALENIGGRMRLRISSVDHLFDLGPGEMPPPRVRTIAQLLEKPEELDGTLVLVPRVVKHPASEAWPEPGLSGAISVLNESGPQILEVFLNRFTDVGYWAEPEFPADFVGVFARYRDSGDPAVDYQLIPRSRADILPASEALTGFAAWQTEFFGESPDSDPEADPDGDGVINLLEYAFGGNPHEPSRNILPAVNRDGNHAEIVFRRVRNAEDLVYEVEVSQDLVVWETIWSSLKFPFDSEEPITEVRVADVETEISERRFLRVRVSMP